MSGADAFGIDLEGEQLIVLRLPDTDLGDAASRRARLTPAEQDVVRLLIRGCSNAEIAEARGSRERTVANQVASIFRKMGAFSRAEVAARLTDQPSGDG